MPRTSCRRRDRNDVARVHHDPVVAHLDVRTSQPTDGSGICHTTVVVQHDPHPRLVELDVPVAADNPGWMGHSSPRSSSNRAAPVGRALEPRTSTAGSSGITPPPTITLVSCLGGWCSPVTIVGGGALALAFSTATRVSRSVPRLTPN